MSDFKQTFVSLKNLIIRGDFSKIFFKLGLRIKKGFYFSLFQLKRLGGKPKVRVNGKFGLLKS